ncbi:hypothetical protein [Lichenifustis flavocetrariae]|uniref:Uncharacterized protein n=1 Tax=Lichenifustis flavocetrariae TaxID=2949735 RepID=A0AA41YUP0_9HYPH|nr:hypothetical protein [Lichenifustis flavocetrariae]MCW6508901.1 hypothetical protein [Lichenifustis flavocetrariae]
MILAAPVVPALAANSGSQPPIAGDYLCASGCRLTDAPPSVEIIGQDAHCMSELGGIYYGRLLTDRSVYCFNKTGVLSDDGTRILWSDGAIWRRR